ncbi:MAG: D-alanyl-D-alanine carboxypeptidase [Ruminococcus sp.]|nr:D-alanyl-D-alanine carboxypeptidase [Ruminococcus sp.]
MLKRIFTLLLSVTIISLSFVTVHSVENSNTDKPGISAESAVLYCVNDGNVYFSKDENKKMKNASTTKIMTALLAYEEAQKENKNVKFTKEMIAEGSSMYLEVGNVVSLKDLASGMMACSGNDAANAIALTLSDSFEGFAEKMNLKAKQLGMNNTNFVTPSGLDDENHYSTAYDLALLMAFALDNPDFAESNAKKSVKVDFVSPDDKSVTYRNHNRLLSLYEYCIGGKTGYTMAAGRCLVSAAEQNGLRFVCVTLNDKNDWKDHQSLYEYGFANYSLYSCDDTSYYLEVPVVGGNKDTVTVGSDRKYGIVLTKDKVEKVERTVYMDNFLYAPVKDGDYLGKVIYTLENKKIAETPLVAMTYSNLK